MNMITLNNFGPIVSDKSIGDNIYSLIRDGIKNGEPLEVDLSSIKSMATFNAKQIFGRLYVELGPNDFFNLIHIKGASNDLKIIIKMGIQSALEENR